MKIIVAIAHCIFLISCLNGAQAADQMVIESGEASYADDKITLAGEVSVQHPLGKICARQIDFSRGETGKEFAHIHLVDSVKIEFSNGGLLECHEASIDYDLLQGHFFGQKSTQLSFCQPEQIVLKADELQVDFIGIPVEQAKKHAIKKMFLQGNISVVYRQEMVLESQQATFLSKEGAVEWGVGILTMQNPDNTRIKLTRLNGDCVDAVLAILTLPEKTLHLESVQGQIKSINNSGQNNLNFTAGLMDWDHSLETLTFNQGVELFHPLYDLSTPNPVVVKRIGNVVQSILAQSETRINYRDTRREIIHQVSCPGRCLCQYANHRIEMEGSIEENKQILFLDGFGEIRGDRMVIEGLLSAKRLTPSIVAIDGNVKVIVRSHESHNDSESILHYAFADQLIYAILEGEVHMRAKENERVYFYDKLNSMQMSAVALKMTAVNDKGKEKIQGIGDVRFTFIESEFEQFKQRFKLQSNSHLK